MNYSTLQTTLKNYRESDARLALYIGKLNGKKETLEAMLKEVYYQASIWCLNFEGSSCSIVTHVTLPQAIPVLPTIPELVPAPHRLSSLFTRYNLAVALYATAIALTALIPY